MANSRRRVALKLPITLRAFGPLSEIAFVLCRPTEKTFGLSEGAVAGGYEGEHSVFGADRLPPRWDGSERNVAADALLFHSQENVTRREVEMECIFDISVAKACLGETGIPREFLGTVCQETEMHSACDVVYEDRRIFQIPLGSDFNVVGIDQKSLDS